MKFCNSCKKTKTILEFSKNKCRKDGYENQCKFCRYGYLKKYRSTEKGKVANRKGYTNWRLKNLQEKAFIEATRRADKLKRTPKWANINKIKDFYLNCPKGYHVDHIIPLKGKNISGLHIETNLQYLPAEENLKKGNRYGSF